MLVAKCAKTLQEFAAGGAQATLALHRLDEDGRRLVGDRGLDEIEVTEGDLVEAGRLGAETFEIFRLAAGGDGRQGAAMESAFEGDDVEAFGMALGIMITPRGLDRAFQRLGAGIGEEHLVGEGRRRQAGGELLLAGAFVQIGEMPELFGLRLHRLDEMGMGMAQRIDGDAGREIEIALAAFGHQPDALAALEPQRDAIVGLKEGRGFSHGINSRK